MIYLIHGNDIAKSRAKLQDLVRTSDFEKVMLDGKKITLEEIKSAIESKSLFTEEKLLIIENFFQRKIGSEKKAIEAYLFNTNSNLSLLLWENREIDKAKISRLKGNIKIEKFDFPENLFKFLEYLGSKPVAELLSQFHGLLKANEPELIFTMIVRQFRYLIMVKEEEGNDIGLPDWQYFKYKSQSRYFTLQQLISLYRQLLDIDYRTKTGKTPLKKDQLLDIFLASL